jgi:hypothetical protein
MVQVDAANTRGAMRARLKMHGYLPGYNGGLLCFGLNVNAINPLILLDFQPHNQY